MKCIFLGVLYKKLQKKLWSHYDSNRDLVCIRLFLVFVHFESHTEMAEKNVVGKMIIIYWIDIIGNILLVLYNYWLKTLSGYKF